MLESIELNLTVSVMILATIYIIADYRQNRKLIYLLKPLTMFVIIIIALTGTPIDRTYQILIVAGLFASLVGDYFLMLPSDRFLSGLISFLIAHLFYIAAFLLLVNTSSNWWILVVFGLLAVIVYRQLQSGLGTLKPAVIVYMTVIAIMGWRAWEVWLIKDDVMGLLAALGATLFIISDTALAFEKFGKPYTAARGLIMGTYFSGQLLIALSI